MKKYQKMIACSVAIAISAGTTGAYAFSQRHNASAINTDTVETETPVVQEKNITERVSADGQPFKSETVYVLCNSDSTIRDIIVSDWLKNPKALGNIADVSTLSNIQNVKGDETFAQSGEDLTWFAGGNDIYYKGQSNETLPVDVNVTYTLDGRRVSLNDIKGKSGHLVIEYTYTNNAVVTQTVNGKDRRIAVPFMAASTAILSNDVFQNVTVTNGRVISDGEKMIVVGMAFPSLAESLGLDEMENFDMEIPESFTIEADVQNFEMQGTMTVVSNEIFNDIDFDKTDSLDELQDKINELNDAANQLCDGTTQLYDGIDQLSGGVGDLTDGVNQLFDGSKELKSGASQLSDGATQLYDGSVELADGCANSF